MRGIGWGAAGLTRMTAVVVGAAVVIAGSSVEATARHRKHLTRHHCACHAVHLVQVTPAVAPRLGPMRYYGGPKSPMWRAPVEN